MLKLPSRQALKALRNPFRSPFPNPLRGPLQTRYLHDGPVPFSGPPSYATLAQRFSASNPCPIAFFRLKAAREASERGQFVNILDTGVDPKDYDVLITDIDNNTLQSEISELVDIPYLKEATKDEANKVPKDIHGFLYGQTFRMIFPCVLGIQDKARWVFFIVDTGAPRTYISAQVAQAFGLNLNADPWAANIAGLPFPVYLAPPDSHFSELNLLGQDFCYLYGLRPWTEGLCRTVTYYMGNNWEDPKPKL